MTDPEKPEPRTSAERQANLRARAKAKGWVRRDYYATPKEHDQLAAHLRKLREK